MRENRLGNIIREACKANGWVGDATEVDDHFRIVVYDYGLLLNLAREHWPLDIPEDQWPDRVNRLMTRIADAREKLRLSAGQPE